MFSGVITMHSGGVLMIHLLWLLVVGLILLLALPVTIAGWYARRSEQGPDQG